MIFQVPGGLVSGVMMDCGMLVPEDGTLAGMTPLEVAESLRHLPGMVFFDSAGGEKTGISRILARPTSVLTGNLHDVADLANLRRAYEEGICANVEQQTGGLCGWVEYEGDFAFGDYREMLEFDHASGLWSEVGGLSREFQKKPAEAVEVGKFRETTTQEAFVNAVRRAKDWIAAGDIYQVNVSQAFEATVAGGSLFGLYAVLRQMSPAPMAAWLSLNEREVLSSSPESFLRVAGRRVETRPIKGTRPRFADPTADAQSARELRESAKESAELVMITDLLRNDIGQVCEFGSVQVSELLRLESFAQVHHLVSTVTGVLRPEKHALDVLSACFPGGSITGAPKKRAMEIIRELEPARRGIYCGAIGWLGYDGDAHFNIAIRTLVRHGGQLSYHTGAGIVADSDPEQEYQETLHKAAGIRLALEKWSHQDTQ